MANIKVTEENLQRAIDLYCSSDDILLRDVAKQIGVDQFTLSGHLRKRGVRIRRGKNAKRICKEIIQRRRKMEYRSYKALL